MRTWCRGVALLVAVLVAARAAEEYRSPEAVAADPTGRWLYVTERTGRAVARIDLESDRLHDRVPLGLEPNGLALSPDGARLYVAAGGANGKVLIVDPAAGKLVGSLPAGHTPTAPVVSPAGDTLYVCCQHNHEVHRYDLSASKVVAKIRVQREPVAAALTPDGKWLYVANLLPVGRADGEVVAAAVSVIDTAANQVSATIDLPNGSTGLHGVCLSPDGKFVYVTHTLGRFHMPTTQLERGWMNTNALTVIDAGAQRAVNTVLLDDVDLGAANPWGVACTPDGQYLCVAHSSTHEISVIDRAELHAKLDRVAGGEAVTVVSRTPEDVPNDLSFLVGIRRRLPVAGNGPRGLAIVGHRAYAAEYFSDTVAVLDCDPAARPAPRQIPLGPTPTLSQVRRGELLFHDATMCFQHWQSCTSCHPGVRTDGLNWDLMNDGLGNPKQTKSMLYTHETPPAMMSGVRESAEVAVRSGIRYIQFAVRPEEDAEAIDAFLRSLRPVPSPWLVGGKLSPAAERGRRVFAAAGCGECHSGRYYTDQQSHDVGTGTGLDEGKAYDTPTLIEVWRTAPYLVDGRAATMMEVLSVFNPDDRHGRTSALSAQELEDLCAFVLSL